MKPPDEGALDRGDDGALAPADEGALKPGEESALTTILRTSILGMLATAALLGVLTATPGLGVAGWIAGLAAGSAAAALIATARMLSDQPEILPADWVTLARAVLVAGVAGLVADSTGRPLPMTALVTLSAMALALDSVDGQVARRTGTPTPLGARLDGEVDAFLILLLSIAVSRSYGSWVLAIGAARYALLLAGWLMPWLAAPLPPRYWRKVVAAVQGIVLTVVVSGQVSRLVGMFAVCGALLLLAESFGRDVIWLYRAGVSSRTRRALLLLITVPSVVLVWGALVAPDRNFQLTPAAFVRIPVEGLALVAVAMVLPSRSRRIVAAAAGVLLGLLTVIKIFDMGFYEEIGRPFNPVFDWGAIYPAVGAVRDAIGSRSTDTALIELLLIFILLLSAIAAAMIRITTEAAVHVRAAVPGLAALTAVWALCAGLSLQLIPGSPVGSTSAAGLVVAQVRDTQRMIREQHYFERLLHGPDPEASIPATDLLSGLRGKDVIIAFVESYGQAAVQGTSFSPGVDADLRRTTAALARAGWATQSAWVTSPSFGGVSWLGHSTLESGLWVDTDQLYAQLVGSRRFTLTDAFNKAGWSTVSDAPADDDHWPPGRSFYHFDKVYNRRNVGYHGPKFSYATMPDQYTLAEFQRRELAPGHKPVMAEIDLVSSHWPWAPLPTMVPWNKVGNGSIFDPMPARSESPTTVWRSASTLHQFFGRSIRYSLDALTSWVTELKDPNLVLILLGDEQPPSVISGNFASHVVPISIVARDPSVFRQIASWHWQDGLLPGRSAPLERMDAFRNQFLEAFSSVSSQAAAARR
ncbi:MAG: CDP-alcohol phosphatidyltransferase family protein [Streptosporangiaceae bacterium]